MTHISGVVAIIEVHDYSCGVPVHVCATVVQPYVVVYHEPKMAKINMFLHFLN